MHPVRNVTIKAYAVHQLFENLLILEQMFVSSKHGCLGHSLQLPFSQHTWLRSLPSLTWTVMASDRLYKWQPQQFWQRGALTPNTVGCAAQCTVCLLHACLTLPHACHSSHIIAGEWAEIRLDSSIIPTQEGKKIKNETQGKLKDYTIWPYLAVRVWMCVCVYACS